MQLPGQNIPKAPIGEVSSIHPCEIKDYESRLAELESSSNSVEIFIAAHLETQALRNGHFDKPRHPPKNLQRFFDLSDEETEFQIFDRFSFMRFLSLRLSDRAPEHSTIWAFKERLGEKAVLALLQVPVDRSALK